MVCFTSVSCRIVCDDSDCPRHYISDCILDVGGSLQGITTNACATLHAQL